MPPLILQLRIAGQIRLAAYGYLCFYRLSQGDNTVFRVDDIDISDMRDHRNNNAIRIGRPIIGYRRRDRYRPRLICLRNSDIVRRARGSRRGQCNAVVACTPSYGGRFVHVLVRNRQRGMGLFNAVGHLERTATGDNDARVLFCRSTAGFPREHDLAAHDFESIAEFVSGNGIDLAVIVNLAAAKTITSVGLRPVTIGNRAFAAGHAADNATFRLTRNGTGAEAVFNCCAFGGNTAQNASGAVTRADVRCTVAVFKQ